MSEIDRYEHECIGMVHCPSSYWSSSSGIDLSEEVERHIPLYLLGEDALDSDDFQAKQSDLLLDGGSGEASALWISMPEALLFFTHGDDEELFPAEMFPTIGDMHDGVYYAYWSPTEAYVFCEGYRKVGWHPEHSAAIEIWLVQHILAFVLREYPDLWDHLRGPDELYEDGSICRLPTPKQMKLS